MKPLDGAILLGGYGIRTFPTHGIREDGGCTCGSSDCTSQGKHPIGRGWQNSATSDPEELRQLWTRYPYANLGVACGEASGVIVLDVDGPDGQQSLAILESEHGPIPMTWTVQTGRNDGGQHIYFRFRPGLKNDVKVVDGLDVRANGGLVIAPPSLHVSGNYYKWKTNHTPATCELADMPDWLFEALGKKRSKVLVVESADKKFKDPRYWLKHYVAEAATGKRNDLGFDLAGQLRDNCLNTGVSTESECIAIMREYARQVTQAGKPYTEREALASWESSLTRSPRDPAGSTEVYIADPAEATPEDDSGPIQFQIATEFTDIGNGKRLIDQFAPGNLLYNRDSGRWLVWTGEYWQPDLDGAMIRKASETIEQLYKVLPRVVKSQQAILLKHIQKSLSMPRINGMIDAAASCKGIKRPASDFDAKPYHLCVQNGVIDLTTGILQPFQKSLMLTCQLQIEYDPGAQCPHWERFLGQVQPDPEVRLYLQKAAGYTLTGDASEQCLFFCFGRGLNGKSTFIETLACLLGDYYGKTPAETIMAKRQGGGIPNDVAALAGKRMISASELSKYGYLNEGLVKDLTGGDAVSARFLNKEFFQFRSDAKWWLYGNEKPKISGTDDGIWRRMRLIPWRVRVPESQIEAQIQGVDYWKDERLKERLHAELPGILAWAVRGCLMWQREKLGKPAAISEASKAYRTEQDSLAEFFDTECEMGRGFTCTKGELWERYKNWAYLAGEKGKVSQKMFHADLIAHDGISEGNTGTVRFWRGLRLKAYSYTDTTDTTDTNLHEFPHEDQQLGGPQNFDSRVSPVRNPKEEDWEA